MPYFSLDYDGRVRDPAAAVLEQAEHLHRSEPGPGREPRRKSPPATRRSRCTSAKACTSARRSTAKSPPQTSPTRSSAGRTPTSQTRTSSPTSRRSKACQGAKGGPIKGIVTPDKHTIVFHLTEPKGQFVAERAGAAADGGRCRRNTPKNSTRTSRSNYGTVPGRHRARTCSRTTARARCSGIGYFPGKSATLVRNPNWNASTDFRPAYLNEINIKIGGDHAVIGRQVLEGTNIVAERHRRRQSISSWRPKSTRASCRSHPGAGNHYIALNNKRTDRSPTSTCARRSGRRSTARRWTRPAAARWSPT